MPEINVVTWGLFAILVEGLIEYLLAWIFDWRKWRTELLRYAAYLVALGLCFNYRLDLVREISGIETGIPAVGYIMTAFVLGRGSNYIHDLLSVLQGFRKGG